MGATTLRLLGDCEVVEVEEVEGRVDQVADGRSQLCRRLLPEQGGEAVNTNCLASGAVAPAIRQ